MMTAKGFFTKKQQADIVYVIKVAEIETSCEFRVHVEGNSTKDTETRANEMFHELGIPGTSYRNGVLFFISANRQELAIVVDEGLLKNPGIDFFKNIKKIALDRFKKQHFAEGIEDAIRECGHQLKKHFPIERNDPNELTDEITFS